MPTIAIITVVLNDIKGLERTFSSVTNQTSNDFEWIVIDGNSTDGSIEFLSKHDNLIEKWLSESDRGIYDAMNKGVKLTSADFVIFMNAGDEFSDPTVIEFICTNVLKSDNSVDVLLGGTQQTFKNLDVYRPPKPLKFITKGLPAFHQSTIYRTQRLRQRPYSSSYTLLADYEWLADCFTKGANLAIVDRPISRFHVGGASYRAFSQKSRELYAINREILKLNIFHAALNYLTALAKSVTGLAITRFPFRFSKEPLSLGRTSVPSGKVSFLAHQFSVEN